MFGKHDDEKGIAHRECDFSFLLASSEQAVAAVAATTFSPAFFPSGARDLEATDSGGFFRRTLTSVTFAGSEFLLPVTNSRKDERELSLLRLLRPLQGHGGFGGGTALGVLLNMVPVTRRRVEGVSLSIRRRLCSAASPSSGTGTQVMVIGPGIEPSAAHRSPFGWLRNAPPRY